LAEFVDRVVKVDAIFFSEGFGVVFNAIGAFRDIGAAAFECGDYFTAGNVIFGVRVVDVFGEGGNVGCVAADDADADIGGGGWPRKNAKNTKKKGEPGSQSKWRTRPNGE
jgi:hypothetical protein